MSTFLKHEIFVLFTIFCLAASTYVNIPIFDVTCDVSGVHVLLKFEKPFEGIVYSANHNFEEKCRKSAESSGNVLLFLPIHACGNEIKGNRTRSISNVIVVQQHPLLQTIYDITQDIMCEVFSSSKRFFLHKFIGNTSNDLEFHELEIWADLKKGLDVRGISTKTVNLGTKMLLTIHVKDGGLHNDINIQNCIAHNEEPIKNISNVARLSDEHGCPYPLGMIGEFNSTKETKNKSDIMAYAELRAFKFPSQENMFITCGVRLCQYACLDTCNKFHGMNLEEFSVLKERSKRSYQDVDTFPIKAVANRNRFMKATLNALTSTLNKKQRDLTNGNTLERRLFDGIDIDVLDNQTPTEDSAVMTFIHDGIFYSTPKPNLVNQISSAITHKSSTEDIDFQYELSSPNIQPRKSLTTEALNTSITLQKLKRMQSSELSRNLLKEHSLNEICLNVTKAFFVTNSGKHSEDFGDQLRDETATYPESVPKIRFSLVTGMLSAILFCLVLTCIALVLHMRREKKKHLIDNFLLYNFD